MPTNPVPSPSGPLRITRLNMSEWRPFLVVVSAGRDRFLALNYESGSSEFHGCLQLTAVSLQAAPGGGFTISPPLAIPYDGVCTPSLTITNPEYILEVATLNGEASEFYTGTYLAHFDPARIEPARPKSDLIL